MNRYEEKKKEEADLTRNGPEEGTVEENCYNANTSPRAYSTFYT